VAIYSSFGLLLAYGYGFLGREGLFLYAKARLALYGEPARLENLGLVYPPTGLLLNLPGAILGWPVAPVFLSALAGGITLTALVYLWRHAQVGRASAVLVAIVMALHPLSLQAFGTGSSTAWAAAWLLLALLSLIKLLERRISYYLMFCGLAMGAYTLSRFDGVLILLLFAPFVPFVFREYSFSGRWALLAVYLMLLSPALFGLAGWVFLNWVFLGDGWAFLRDPQLYVRIPGVLEPGSTDLLVVRSSLLDAMWTGITWTAIGVPLFPLVVARSGRLSGLLLASWLGYWILAYFGAIRPAAEDLVLLLLLGSAAAFLPGRRPNRLWYGSLMIALVLTIPGSLHLLQRYGTAEARELWSGSPPPIWEQARAAAERLSKAQTILLDDTEGFPIVACFPDLSRLLLPYRGYRFAEALAAPERHAEALVLPDPGYGNGRLDRLHRSFPDWQLEGIAGFHLEERIGPWYIFLRKGEAP
jgi:hypothetical protein